MTTENEDNILYFSKLCELEDAQNNYNALVESGNHAAAKIKGAYSKIKVIERSIKKEGNKLDGVTETRRRDTSPITKLFIYYLQQHPNGGIKITNDNAPSFLAWVDNCIGSNAQFNDIQDLEWIDDSLQVYDKYTGSKSVQSLAAMPAAFSRVKKSLEK